MIRRNHKLSSLLLLFVFLFFGNSCKKSTQIPVFNPEFIHFISAYTTGVIENSSTIRIVLLKPIEDTTDLYEKTQDLFSFSPKIEGRAYYTDAQTFVFEPSEPLEEGKVFQGEFELGDVMDVKRDLRTFHFQFETERQHLNYGYSDLRSYSNPEYQYLEGSVELNNRVEIEELEDVLVAKLGSEDLKVTWSHYYSSNYRFRIDSIARGEKSENLILVFDGKSIGAIETFNRQYVLRGLAEFNISNVETTFEPDQKITINFSDPLDQNQDLTGLITVSKVSNIKLEKSNNTVTVFFPSRISGGHKLLISNKIKNYNGYPLIEEDSRNIYFEKPKPKLRLVGKGTIYPMNSKVYFPFETIGLKAVDVRVFKIYNRNVHQFLQVNDIDDNSQLARVGKLIHKGKVTLRGLGKNAELEWNRSTIDLSKYISKDPGAIYRVMLSFKKSYTYYKCSGGEDYGPDENELYWSYYSDYYYTRNYTPCQSSYYYRSSRTKNIIASQIGLIAKRDRKNTYHLFVNHINTSQPMANVKLQFYDYQKNVIKETYSNGTGMASVTLSEDENPFLLVATAGKQKSYLKLNDGLSNSLSKFEVDGVAPTKEGIKGFIYAERGVWRPGDDIHLAFILENKLSKSYPVKMQLFDPNGKKVDKQIKTKNTGGIYSFKTKTNSVAKTGNYNVKIEVGNNTYHKSLKIETVKPNRLKMAIKFDDGFLKSYGLNKGKFKSSWLHGAKAKGLRARITAKVTKGTNPFDKYKSYIFADPTKSYSAQSMVVFDEKLDDNGETELEPEFGIKKGAPGFLRVSFTSQVYEKGGNFSTDNSYFNLSPYQYYTGMHIPKGTLEYGTLVTGEDHNIDLISLDATGKEMANRELNVKVYKMDWSWWWERNRNLSNYVSAHNLLPYQEKNIKTNSKGKGAFKLRIDQPDWGRFLVIVKDENSGHSTGKIVYVDWPYWARKNRKNADNANMLSFSTNKKVYSKGEEVQISIPGAPQGKLLVCVENGSSVLKKFWANASEGETKIKFRTTADMNPNVYVHIMGLQDYSATSNDLPVRMYGIVPIRVEDPKTHLYPKISIKDSIRPDEFQYVTVNEKSGRPMAYTLAIVDEGLLNLTGYRNPNPWHHFNKKEALGVTTWDIYKHVIGAFGLKFGNVLSVGGGDFDTRSKKSSVKANRFKPVVKYFGPYYLNANQSKKHKFKISNYVGAVRVMVVAANNGAYGSTSKSVKVKKPLMVVSTLPRTLSPTEEIEIPVNVFAMQKGLGKIRVELKSIDGIKIENSVKSIVLNDVDDEVVTFKGKVDNSNGIVKVIAKVSSGNEKASHTTEMNIRLPNPEIHRIQEYVVEAGKSVNTNLNYFGISGTNKAVVEVSKIPPINLQKRLNYLIQYPHGCIEQTTSGAFPQLFLSKVTNLSVSQKKSIHRNMEAAIFRLQNFQTSSGGFSYWPGGYESNSWGTNYAGHYLLMAEREGYTIPSTLKNNWLRYQKQAANSWVPSKYNNNDLQQAYRLYTLALAGQAQLASMNRLKEDKNLGTTAKWKLAAAYSLIGRQDVAKKLTNSLPTKVKDYRELNQTFGSSTRDKALILETLTLMKSSTEAAKVAISLAKDLGSDRWMSTQETAYGLMSMANYMGKFQNSQTMTLSYSVNGKNSKTVNSNKSLYQIQLTDVKNKVNIKNTSNSILYIKSIVSGVLLNTKDERVSENLNMSVEYKDLSGAIIDVTKLEQGVQFVAEFSITNPSNRRRLEQMALTHMVPSGWEIQNSRMANGAFTTSESSLQYRDYRDDRVNTYFSLSPGETKKYRVVLTATYLGRYVMPMITCEAMYDYSVRANIPGKWVEIVKEQAHENASQE